MKCRGRSLPFLVMVVGLIVIVIVILLPLSPKSDEAPRPYHRHDAQGGAWQSDAGIQFATSPLTPSDSGILIATSPLTLTAGKGLTNSSWTAEQACISVNEDGEIKVKDPHFGFATFQIEDSMLDKIVARRRQSAQQSRVETAR